MTKQSPDDNVVVKKSLLFMSRRVASAARAIVGGQSDLMARPEPSAHITNLPDLCNELRQAIDEYDNEISRMNREKS